MKKKKKKKQKGSKKRSRSSSASSSSSGSTASSDSSVFRFPSSKEAGHENSIQEMAAKHPGRLLRAGLKAMREFAEPTEVLGGGRQDPLPAIAMKYLLTVLNTASEGDLSRRDKRELKTLATAIDFLARGKMAQLGDLLIQRFKSVETSSQTKSWRIAQNQELIGREGASTTSHKEREIAARVALREAQMQEVFRKQSGSG